jgi:NADPH2:quinone reductase
MNAAFIQKTGPPEVIQYAELPDPVAGPGQHLVKVAAVDVNPIDIYIRSGAIPAQLKFPYIIGRDLAGEIVSSGPGANRFKPGDRVWASGQGVGDRQGTFAELVAVDEQWLHPVPDGVSMDEIAALSLVAITAHLGLRSRAKLRANEILFVNGGSGGVGSSVVQMARIIGARVITTAGSDKKIAKCRSLGAEHAINYKTENVSQRVREYAPGGVDVWWETLREPNLEQTIPLMAMGGRVIIMAGREAKPVLPVGQFYTRDSAILGFAAFNASAAQQSEAAREINEWVAQKKLRACIDRVMPLLEAAAAHRLQEESTLGKTGALSGKIVLIP